MALLTKQGKVKVEERERKQGVGESFGYVTNQILHNDSTDLIFAFKSIILFKICYITNNMFGLFVLKNYKLQFGQNLFSNDFCTNHSFGVLDEKPNMPKPKLHFKLKPTKYLPSQEPNHQHLTWATTMHTLTIVSISGACIAFVH